MREKITNIGGHKVFRYYDECLHCGGEMQSIVFYGNVCLECDKSDVTIEKDTGEND